MGILGPLVKDVMKLRKTNNATIILGITLMLASVFISKSQPHFRLDSDAVIRFGLMSLPFIMSYCLCRFSIYLNKYNGMLYLIINQILILSSSYYAFLLIQSSGKDVPGKAEGIVYLLFYVPQYAILIVLFIINVIFFGFKIVSNQRIRADTHNKTLK